MPVDRSETRGQSFGVAVRSLQPVLLGFGSGLAGFLDRLVGMEANSENRFLVMYLQSHPPTALNRPAGVDAGEVRAAVCFA